MNITIRKTVVAIPRGWRVLKKGTVLRARDRRYAMRIKRWVGVWFPGDRAGCNMSCASAYIRKKTNNNLVKNTKT